MHCLVFGISVEQEMADSGGQTTKNVLWKADREENGTHRNEIIVIIQSDSERPAAKSNLT